MSGFAVNAGRSRRERCATSNSVVCAELWLPLCLFRLTRSWLTSLFDGDLDKNSSHRAKSSSPSALPSLRRRKCSSSTPGCIADDISEPFTIVIRCIAAQTTEELRKSSRNLPSDRQRPYLIDIAIAEGPRYGHERTEY